MKYRLEGMIVEAIDTYVRITTRANTDYPKVAVTKKECPKATDVASLLAELQGYYPNPTQLQVCSRAANDARDNKTVLAL